MSYCSQGYDLVVLERELHCQLINKSEDLVIIASMSQLKQLHLYIKQLAIFYFEVQVLPCIIWHEPGPLSGISCQSSCVI
jgi:hypothetical protein